MRPRKAIVALLTAGVLAAILTAACGQSETATPFPAAQIVAPAPVAPTSIAAGGTGPTTEQAQQPVVRVEYGGTPGGRQEGLWANGHGQVKAAPDLAYLNVGVRATEPTVGEANSEAASSLNAMMDVLRESGLDDADFQTSSLSIRQETQGREVTRCPDEPTGISMSPAQPMVSRAVTPPAPAVAATSAVSTDVIVEVPPKEDQTLDVEPKPEENGQPVLGEEDVEAIMSEIAGAMASAMADFAMAPQAECYTVWEQVVIGYTVSQELTVKVRDLDSIGELLDQVVEAGGDQTRVNGISFTIEDPAPLVEQAREMAVEDLLDRAGKMADAAGVTLGKLEHLSEGGASVLEAREESFLRAAPAAMAFDASAASTPVSAGEVTVTANVSGGFSIAEE